MEKYIAPEIKVKRMIAADAMLAASVGMNTGDGLGNEKGSGGQMAKDNGFVITQTNVWGDDEEEDQ